MSYITIRLPFNTSGYVSSRLLSTAWLFKIATHKMLQLAKSSSLPSTDIGWKKTFRKTIYEIIPNYRYTDGVITLVRSIYESCRRLGLDFKKVELKDWLMFQQAYKEYPVRNITLKQNYEFHITTIDYNMNIERVIVRPTIPKNYRLLINKIIEEKQQYIAKTVIKDYGVRNKLWIHGEIHLAVPIDFYYKHMVRYKKNYGKLYGGVDVNTDRINLAIIDEVGRLRDIKTFWFPEVTAKGYKRYKAKIIIGMRIHEMLRYAYHHGVKILFLENPEILGRLKVLWKINGKKLHSNYNWKVSIFRSRIIEMIAFKSPLYSINVTYIDPKGTTNSLEHSKIMKKYRLDRHTASAYLISLKGLNIL